MAGSEGSHNIGAAAGEAAAALRPYPEPMHLSETSPVSQAEYLMSSIELWGTEYETAGRLDVEPGTATTDEPTHVAEVAGRWVSTMAAVVGDDEAAAIGTAVIGWLAARAEVGRAAAAANAPGAAADAFELGRALGVAEENARHHREAWALPLLQIWADEAAER